MKKTSQNDQSRAARKEKRPQDWRPQERLMALRESHGLTGEALNAWCRERSLFVHHLAQWQGEFCRATSPTPSRADSPGVACAQRGKPASSAGIDPQGESFGRGGGAVGVLEKKYPALLGGEVE
ncbi:MAG: transposase [Gammaproteobacteria bacterium]